jgi:Tol biopolymer transport system component
VWTPEGKRVIFSTDRTATGTSLFWQPPDGSAAAERVLEGRGAIAYTMHGSSLIVRGVDGRGASDLMILGLDEDGPVRSDSRLVLKPITKTPFEESNAAFSPDGRWLAYQSNSSSRFEVYVQPFPSGRQLLVSTGGGGEPVWGPDNRELFYRSPDGAVMRVAISDSTPLTASTPTRLFAGSSYAVAGRSYFLNTYDISPDGKRFLMMKNGERTDRAPTVERIIVVQDWLEELTAKVRR